MKDEFFHHIKHRLAETPVPDPELAWQQMNVLLDAEEIPRKLTIRSLHWWQAAACLLVASAVWAMYHEWGAVRRWQMAGAHLSLSHLASGSVAPGMPASGNTTPGGATSGSLASGSTAPGGPASGSTAPGGPASGNTGLGNTASGNTAFGGPASGNMPQGDLVPGNKVRNNRQTGGRQTSGFFPAGKGTPDALFMDGQDAGAASPMATAGHNNLSIGNNLFISPADGIFLMDRPAASPLTSAGKKPEGMNPAVAVDALHIRNPRHLPRWSFDIGLAANAPGSFRKIDNDGQTKLEPGVYPVVFVSKRFSTPRSVGKGRKAPAPLAKYK
jgi:hypothetical protein